MADLITRAKSRGFLEKKLSQPIEVYEHDLNTNDLSTDDLTTDYITTDYITTDYITTDYITIDDIATDYTTTDNNTCAISIMANIKKFKTTGPQPANKKSKLAPKNPESKASSTEDRSSGHSTSLTAPTSPFVIRATSG
ncbi:hypothetical protein MBLNU13_g09388t2 [Cladosporium sp. NU13]